MGHVKLRRFGRRIGIVAILVIVTSIGFVIVRTVFDIREILLVGKDIKVEINYSKFPRNLLFFPVSQLREDLLYRYPVLSLVEVKKKYPSSLVISLAVRDPVLVVQTSSQTIYIDAFGFATLPQANDQRLPTLAAREIAPVSIGAALEDPIVKLAVAFLGCKLTDLLLLSLEITQERSLRVIFDNMEVVLLPGSDAQAKCATLQSLVRGFRMKGGLPARVDLRFDKPIVTY